MPANEKTATNCKVKKPKTCLNTWFCACFVAYSSRIKIYNSEY